MCWPITSERVFENSSSTHQIHTTQTPNKKYPPPPHTQVLHPIPQHQPTPHTNQRIPHTPTTHITPLRTLDTPKHRLYPITLTQRPTLLLSTRPRTQTPLIPHPLMQTRRYPHHGQPTHLKTRTNNCAARPYSLSPTHNAPANDTPPDAPPSRSSHACINRHSFA